MKATGGHGGPPLLSLGNDSMSEPVPLGKLSGAVSDPCF
jgi:hypothetical protein